MELNHLRTISHRPARGSAGWPGGWETGSTPRRWSRHPKFRLPQGLHPLNENCRPSTSTRRTSVRPSPWADVADRRPHMPTVTAQTARARGSAILSGAFVNRAAYRIGDPCPGRYPYGPPLPSSGELRRVHDGRGRVEVGPSVWSRLIAATSARKVTAVGRNPAYVRVGDVVSLVVARGRGSPTTAPASSA